MGNEIRTVLAAIAGSRIPKMAGISFALCLTFTLAIAIAQSVYTQVDAPPPAWIAAIDVWKLGMVIGTAGTATAFLATLFVADRNYRRGREHIPSLTMELHVTRTPASLSYDAVIVTLNARNTGTGLCHVDRIYWTLRVLSPYADATIDEMQRDFESASDSDSELAIEFPWHDVKFAVTSKALVIEPNETEQMTYDFIIPTEIGAIEVSAWVANASEPSYAEGWYRRAVHTTREVFTDAR